MKFTLCGLTIIVIASAIECKEACWLNPNKTQMLFARPTISDCIPDITCDVDVDAKLQLENIRFDKINGRAKEILETYKNASDLGEWSCATENFEIAAAVNAVGLQLTHFKLPIDSKLVHEVNASHNDLTVIHDHSFGNVESLWTLDLSHNRIEDIAEKAFVNNEGTPIKVECLFLNNNNLRSISNICLSIEEKCIYLDVSHNRLESLNWIENGTYSGLEIFKADFNSITSVGAHFRSMSNLEQLSLRGNSIKFIYQSAFFPLRALNSLDLSSNNIETLQPEMFYGLDSLHNLNLSHNKIDGITEEYFKESQYLKILDLSHNNLGQFALSTGREFAPLHYLLIDNNNLTGDEISEVLKFPLKIHKVRVGGKNFNCRTFIYKQARQLVHKNVKSHPEERNEDVEIDCITADREEVFGVSPQNEKRQYVLHIDPWNVWKEVKSWSHSALVDVRICVPKPVIVSDTLTSRESKSNNGSIATVVWATSAIAFVVISVLIGYIVWRRYPSRFYGWRILGNNN